MSSVVGVMFLAAAFIVATWSRLDLPLGRSHDGINTAVWMNGGRAIVEDGLVHSRLGATTAVFGTYAHHPPGLYLIGATAYLIGGTRPFVARLPAVISVVVGLALAWAFLRTIGRSRLACFGALSLAVTTPMLLLWGPMLNHEAIAFPWAFAALLVAARAQHGRPVPAWLAATVGFGAAILSWQGGLLVLLLAMTPVVSRWRRSAETDRRVYLALGVAAVVALALTVAWQLWSYGDLRDVIDAFGLRAGEANTQYGFVEAQVRFAYQSFPLWTIALAAYGLLFIWRDAANASTSAALIATVVLYTVGFRNGATIHVYWSFWLVLVVVVATSAAIDRHMPQAPSVQVGFLCAAVVMVVAYATLIDTKGADSIVIGARAGDVVLHTPVPKGQETFYVFSDVDEPPPWLLYEVQRPVGLLTDPAEVRRLATDQPNAVVMIQRSFVDKVRVGVFDAIAPKAIVARDPYESVRIDDLAAALG